MIFFLLSILTAPAFAADESEMPRPTEDSMFGSEAPPSPAPAPTTKQRDAFASGEVVENPLQVGGILYQQLIVSKQQGVSTKNNAQSAPFQFDGYLDGRPSDRIRAYIDARLLYDPTRDQFSNSTNSNSQAVQTLQTQSTTTSTSATGTTQTPNNPQVVLDQAWLKFDIDHTVFVTAGKQHVKWGTSRFWNPTDLLSTQKRNPLLPYDLRLGNYMAKFDLPLESKKTNIYAIGLFDNPKPASSIGQLGGAIRAETLLGNAEVGLDFVARGGLTPVYGADFSAPIGAFDIYAEAACVTGNISNLQAPNLAAGTDISTAFTTSITPGPAAQVSGGARYDFAWREDRQSTLGVEYFYNQLGYSNSSAYPALIFTGTYQPFYTGRNYLAIYLTAEGPDSLKHTSYGFSTLSNLSDKSFISRLDFTWRILTYLTFQAYVDGHYGPAGGEFNFSLSTPALLNAGTAVSPISIPPTNFDVGVSLRVSI